MPPLLHLSGNILMCCRIERKEQQPGGIPVEPLVHSRGRFCLPLVFQ